MRVAVGGIEHESSGFVPAPTPLRAFETRSCSGKELAQLGGANDVISGLVRGVRHAGLELVPLYWAYANPGGLATKETYDTLKRNLLQPLHAALPVDGVLLSLHGAFSAEGIDDGDGDILTAVREMVGSQCPIISVHDLHCNVSPDMVKQADALIMERTYPHIDMAERGVDAALLMARVLRGEVRPTMAYRPLPLFWSAANMITSEVPMKNAVQRLALSQADPEVLAVNLSLGYQWADSPIVGASTVVVTNNDRQGAQDRADELARWVWERRDLWQRKPLLPKQALELGEQKGRYPIILADQADNPGGGAPGDSTEILRLFLERGLVGACVLYLVDPETAQLAKQAGVGRQIRVLVGGKSHPLLGPPLAMNVEVVALSNGRFTYDGPMWAGREECLGDSALLRQEGTYVLVISKPCQPVDLAFCRSLGLDCQQLRYLSVKSTGHFRSGFGPIAGSIYNVDAAGLLTHDFKRLPFKRLGRKVYPMDQDANVNWSEPMKRN